MTNEKEQAKVRAVGGTGSELGSKSKDRVRNPEGVDAARLMSGEAWDDFCDRLKETGRHVLAEANLDTELDRSDGFRYLANLTQAGIRHAFNLDPRFPKWVRHPDSTSKYGAENADNIYHFSKIRSDLRYRISGRRNTATAFLLETKEGYMQLGDVENYSTLDSEAMTVAPDGTFEIILSAEDPGGAPNWVPLHADATQVLIRQYLCDWETEVPAEFEIVCLDTEGESPEPLRPAPIARKLADAAHWIETTIRVWNEWSVGYRERRKDGVLAPAENYVGGADDIFYGNDAYVLAPDEAIVIESDVPDARYWHYQLVDAWLASMDYTNGQTSLNHTQLHIDADGKVRVVIAHRDPGVPNWLDTGGHLEGLIQYRYIWANDNPQPTIRTLKLGEVRAALPADTPLVTLEARREAIARRQAHIRRREPTC